jgi:UDP-glucuronate decarboxylase
MKILITGGAGFLGTNLIKKLLERGDEIVVLDNLMTGKIENLAQFGNKVKFVEHDVINPLPELGSFDVIYNMACPASPPAYQRDPLHTFKTSAWGAFNVAEYALKCGAHVLQTSTSEIYGDPLVHPQTEDYRGNTNTVGPRSCYDEGKRAAETILYDFKQSKGLSVSIARIFNTYGPEMAPDDGRVISNFIVQSLQGKELTIYGDGKQTRSLCYVEDNIRGLMMLADKKVFGPVNIGNPDEYTIAQIANIISDKVANGKNIVHSSLPIDDPRQRCPDITKAKAFGWEPTTTLDVGLANTIEYFRKKLEL